MAEESLRELLARLHEQLGARGRALDRSDRVAEESAAAAAAHTPRLESLAVRFEAGHPAIAEAVRGLIDALVKAGI